MKNSMTHTRRLLALGTLLCLPLAASLAADSTTPGASAPQPAATTEAQSASVGEPAKLPYGVDDVLKLSKAQINDDIILNYIQNSGTIYNLGPQELVYLRNQGVSDRVLNAMLDQRKKVPAEAAQAAAQAAAVAPAPAPSDSIIAPTYTEPVPAYAEPPVEEIPAPASTVYVIPYPAARAAYYGYSGYSGYYGSYSPYVYYGPTYYGCYRPYRYYGGYCGPTVSFGFRFGGHGFHGGHHGWHHR